MHGRGWRNALAVLCSAWEVVMIGWTKLAVTAAWVMSASLGCAGATPKASTPAYFRSPPLDYAGQEPLRSAADGEVMGANRQAPDEWLQAGMTNAHAGPGWNADYGHLRFRQERARSGNGVFIESPRCEPPAAGPLTPDEAEAHAALHRAWLAATRESPGYTFASAVPDEQPGLLSCDQQ